MVFSSTGFLFLFLPLVWLLYTVVPQKYLAVKNAILSVASVLFYAYGEPVYILIMLASVTVNYFAALGMARLVRGRRVLLTATIILNLGALALFKYVPWVATTVNAAFSLALPVPKLTIPVGISFYTFQILSYVIDVYRGKVAAQRRYGSLFLYISFFPQLIAGPIVKYSDIAAQIESREVTLGKTARGIRRFSVGLGKKVLISNTVAVIADAAFASSSPSSALAWAGAAAYCFQLYFDFSGYSDMAIGLASMFGFSLDENFRYPYIATSVCDFWKRWHISLTSWFREYVYFPLGGSRCSKGRAMFNRFLVFFLSGLWHGANFTYILWGMWHGALMVLEQVTGWSKLSEKRAVRPFSRILALFAVLVGFVVFRAPSVTAALKYLGTMFSFAGNAADVLQYANLWTLVMLAAAVLFSTPVVPFVTERLEKRERIKTLWSACGYGTVLVIFALCVMYLASSSFNPFIYYIF